MGDTRNDRVIALLKNLKIDEMELAQRTGKQPSSIYRITNKENEPTRSTLRQIADALNASYEWLLTGKGEMIQLKKSDKPAESGSLSKALELLEEQLQKKDEQIATLMAIMGGKRNFRKALENYGSTLGFNTKNQGTVSRATA
jgi:transcriptional regulator with XRE-family HTH domain